MHNIIGGKTMKLVLKILTAVFMFLFAILITLTTILFDNQTVVSGYIGAQTQEIIPDPNADPAEAVYYESEFSSVKEEMDNAFKVSEEVVSEGAVLLENAYDSSTGKYALPIDEEKPTVSLFSVSSINHGISGGGSGAGSGVGKVNLKTAMEEAGFSVNADLWNWYAANESKYIWPDKAARVWTIGDAPWADLPDSKLQPADAAVFVLMRLGAEGSDLRSNSMPTDDATNGNYLELSPTEKDILRNLQENTGEGKAFKRLVVVMNTASQVQVDFVEEYDVDALLWVGTTGSRGSLAVGDILRGNVNPSGRISDAFWRKHYLNPVYANWVGNKNGRYYYSLADGSDSSTITQSGIAGTGSPYIVYQEGIYNGYRYLETRYEDKILGRKNVDNAEYEYDYYEAVAYPFGYGLSYTEFEYSAFEFVGYDAETDEYSFSVNVKNTGDVAGKEVVQLYLSKPYDEDYDVENHIEKASVELVGFDKTGLLEPGDDETIVVTTEGKYLASYDAYKAKTYVVGEGTYYFTIAQDSHEATNNVIKSKNPEAQTEAKGKTGTGNTDFVYSTEKAFDAETYSVSDHSGEEVQVTNQFDNADLKLHSPENANAVTYISRNNWTGTTVFGFNEKMEYLNNHVKLAWTQAIANETDDDINADPPESDMEYPTYGSKKTAYSLIDMRVDENGEKRPYDDPLWEDLLDQLTWEDTVKLLCCGVRMTVGLDAINKPMTIDHNGGVGVNQCFNINNNTNRGLAVSTSDPDRSLAPPAYPCNQIVASTFNVELIEEYGRAWGEDCLWAGYSGLYGPGLNIHRGQYCGRTFEYYSEDGFLSGVIAGAVSRGMTEKGAYVYLKHAILNERETDRLVLGTWANEQTIREVYLRPFEIAIIDGGAQCVMTGYNKIGAIYTSKQGFVNSVLKDEFGMTGFAVTDFVRDEHYRRMKMCVLQGTGLVDRDFTMFPVYEGCEPGNKHGDVAQAMREEAHRILYTVVHSNAMNGITSGTKIITYTPAWTFLMRGIDAAVGSMFVASLMLLITCYVAERQKGAQVAAGPRSAPLAEGADGMPFGVKTSGSGETPKSGEHSQKAAGGAAAKSGKKVNALAIVQYCILGVLCAALIVNGGVTGWLMMINTPKNHSITSLLDETKGGEGVVDHIFEAEAAEFTGKSGTKAGYESHACTATSYRVGNGLSGGVALQNIFSPEVEGQEANKLSFKFTADKTVKVMMGMTVSRANSGQYNHRTVADFYDITVNGKEVSTDISIPSEGANAAGMVVADVPITIQEGENEIVLQTKAQRINGEGELDCINIKTSASLTGFVPHYWDMSAFEVTVYAMADRVGKLTIACPECAKTSRCDLPPLTEGVESGFYSVKTDETLGQVYCIAGTDLVAGYDTIPQTEQHKLTVVDDYVTFANGTAETQVWENYPLPEIEYDREDYEIIGWYDMNDTNRQWLAGEFSMPDADLSIKPVWRKNTFCSSVAEGGKVDLDKGGFEGIHTNTVNGFNRNTLTDNIKTGVVMTGEGADRYAEEGFVYSYPGGVKSGWTYITCVPCPANGWTDVTFSMQNQGANTLTFEVWQISLSTNPTAAGNPHKTITLAPGQSITFMLTANLTKNDNILTYYKFLNDSPDYKLAVMEYVEPGTETLPDPGENRTFTIRNADGSPYTVTKGGETTFSVAENAALPALDVVAPEGYQLAGFFETEDPAKKYPYEGFSMPEKDLTVTPYFTADHRADTPFGRAIDYMANSGIARIHQNSINGFGRTALASAMSKTPVLIGEEGEKFYAAVATYNYEGGVQAGWTYIGTTVKAMAETETYHFTYTFYNFGSETISFEAWQTNASGSPTAEGNPHAEITLAPGESRTVEWSVSGFKNNSILLYFAFTADTSSDLSLGVNLYMDK